MIYEPADAYRESPFDETRRAVAALAADAHYAQRYTEFLQVMAYGDQPAYAEALATVLSLSRQFAPRMPGARPPDPESVD